MACPFDLWTDRRFLKEIPNDYMNIYAKCWVFPVFSTVLLTPLWQRLHCLYFKAKKHMLQWHLATV